MAINADGWDDEALFLAMEQSRLQLEEDNRRHEAEAIAESENESRQQATSSSSSNQLLVDVGGSETVEQDDLAELEYIEQEVRMPFLDEEHEEPRHTSLFDIEHQDREDLLEDVDEVRRDDHPRPLEDDDFDRYMRDAMRISLAPVPSDALQGVSEEHREPRITYIFDQERRDVIDLMDDVEEVGRPMDDEGTELQDLVRQEPARHGTVRSEQDAEEEENLYELELPMPNLGDRFRIEDNLAQIEPEPLSPPASIAPQVQTEEDDLVIDEIMQQFHQLENDLQLALVLNQLEESGNGIEPASIASSSTLSVTPGPTIAPLRDPSASSPSITARLGLPPSETKGTPSPVYRSKTTHVGLACPLCLEHEDVDWSSIACGHVFCYGCTMKTIRNNPECPFCRKPIMVHEIRKIFLPI